VSGPYAIFRSPKPLFATAVVLLAVFSQSASAFFDPPYVSPSLPTASDVVSVNIRAGICDTLVGIPGYPQITRDDNSVRILLFAVRYEDSELCSLGVGTATYSIGTYSPGEYSVQVDIFYYDGGGNPRTETLGVVPFTIAGDTPSAIPANGVGRIGLLALILGMLGLAMRQRIR